MTNPKLMVHQLRQRAPLEFIIWDLQPLSNRVSQSRMCIAHPEIMSLTLQFQAIAQSRLLIDMLLLNSLLKLMECQMTYMVKSKKKSWQEIYLCQVKKTISLHHKRAEPAIKNILEGSQTWQSKDSSCSLRRKMLKESVLGLRQVFQQRLTLVIMNCSLILYINLG